MPNNCPKCDGKVPQNARFCPECGTALDLKKPGGKNRAVRKSAQKSAGRLTNTNFIFLVLIAALMVVGMYGYRYIKPPKTDKPHVHTPAESQSNQINREKLNQLQSDVTANPGGLEENIKLGNFLFDNQRFNEALIYYNNAIGIDAQQTDVIVDAGVCYFNLQNFEKAKKYFRKALDINPNHPNALYNLGVVAAQTGEMSDMLDAWNRLIEVAPESQAADAARQMIDQVKSGISDN